MKSLTFSLRKLVSVIVIGVWSFGAGTTVEGYAVPPSQQPVRDGRAARLNAEATSALERGDLKTARDLFQRALEINPNDVVAHTYLGGIADRANDLSSAEHHLAAAARLAPASARARNNYGAVLLRRGRTREAAAEFRASLRLDPKQPSALVNLAQVLFAGGKPDDLREARELFERAWAIAPDADIARAIVVTMLRLGEKVAAAASYRDYAARVASGQGAAASAAARAELGAALLESGLVDEAIKELDAAATIDPSNVNAVIALARGHLRRKDIRSAGRTLEVAVARGVNAAPVYAALADVYEAGGYIENAITAMRLAIARDPQSETYRFRYGMLLTDTKAPAAAVIRLQEALGEFPRSPRLWFALGVAQSALDKYADAAKAFARAIELNPKLAPAHAYLGMTYDQQGQYKEAVALYERALAIDEGLGAAHYLAADAILKQSSPDVSRAEMHLKRAVALDPLFAPARLTLAKLYVRENQLVEAATQLEQAIAADPNLAQAYYQLSRVYMRLKRTAEAHAALAKFKRLSETQQEQSRNEQKEIARRLANVLF